MDSLTGMVNKNDLSDKKKHLTLLAENLTGYKNISTLISYAHLHSVKRNYPELNVNFLDIDVLNDNQFKESMKKFSDWPTFPQLYVKGEFIGGCDIVMELEGKGELSGVLQSAGT